MDGPVCGDAGALLARCVSRDRPGCPQGAERNKPHAGAADRQSLAALAFLRHHASLEIVGEAIVTYYTVIESPIEPLLLTSDGRALTGLLMGVPLQRPGVSEGWTRSDDAAPFAETSRQLALYFQGRLTQFDLPLA